VCGSWPNLWRNRSPHVVALRTIGMISLRPSATAATEFH
jgi:hypothetical protein